VRRASLRERERGNEAERQEHGQSHDHPPTVVAQAFQACENERGQP
jgi:hypothetical protein